MSKACSNEWSGEADAALMKTTFSLRWMRPSEMHGISLWKVPQDSNVQITQKNAHVLRQVECFKVLAMRQV